MALPFYKNKEKLFRRQPGFVCAVGWEPNPDHTPVLNRLEQAYNNCGWKVKTVVQQ